MNQDFKLGEFAQLRSEAGKSGQVCFFMQNLPIVNSGQKVQKWPSLFFHAKINAT